MKFEIVENPEHKVLHLQRNRASLKRKIHNLKIDIEDKIKSSDNPEDYLKHLAKTIEKILIEHP